MSHSNDIRISVVIVNYNTSRLLDDCLQSVYSRTAGASFEVIVVDNGSDDDSVRMVGKRYPQARLVANDRNAGFSVACNAGIREAGGEYVVLLNSDTVLENDALTILADFLDANPRAGICGPRLQNADGTPQKSVAETPTLGRVFWNFAAQTLGGYKPTWQREYEPERFGYDRTLRIEGESLTGACLAIRKSIFDDLGLLDERFFFYMEEADWTLRAARTGWEIWFVADAVVRHLHGASVRLNDRSELMIKIKTMQIRSLQHFYRKHFGPASRAGLRLVLLGFLGTNLLRRWAEQAIGRNESAAYNVRLAKSMVRAIGRS
jgi:GT2 family glycosyltransferase